MAAMPIPCQDPSKRTANFDEVYLPFDEESARIEARRCIQCPKAVCTKACPLQNDIPLALWQLEHGNIEDAAEVFYRTNTMPDVCGRVCPQVALCEGPCVLKKKGKPAVAIGRLEAFVADHHKAHSSAPTNTEPSTGHRVAVVGAGPAGLTVAELLAKLGHAVTVFDAWPTAGGIMRYGIPTFKMDHRLCDDRTALLEQLGVEFVFNTTIGRDVTIQRLFELGHEAVFLGVGAGRAIEMEVPGNQHDGVYSATPFLIRANVEAAKRPADLKDPPAVGEQVAVIGGGDTAMDAVRTAVRLGAKCVTCVYRRTEAEMPGNEKDRELAKEEGVQFKWLTQPVEFVADDRGHVVAMRCVGMELGDPDETGRRRPIPVDGSEFTMPVDTIISALGYGADPIIAESTAGLQTDRWGLITIDEGTGATSLEGVFAGGDDVLGPMLVVTALAQARTAAQAIHKRLAHR
jgi:glutamate synthase (NADPH/NADH) small chain